MAGRGRRAPVRALVGLVVGSVVAGVLLSRWSADELTLRQVVVDEVDAAARRDSGDYVPPTAAQADRLAAAVLALSRGRQEQAEDEAADLGYRVREVEAGGQRLLALTEQGRRRHWGAYVVAPSSGSDLLVEVPHPLSDLRTPEVGLELFQRAGARALLVAGAHRDAGEGDSADVAHRTDSVFEAVHRALLQESSVVAQLHGFDDERRTDPPDVVLSDGSDDPPVLLRRVRSALAGEGLEVCLFRGGPRCRDLAARRNVQGQSARAAGAVFLHVEAAPALRADAPGRRRLVDALLRGLVPGGTQRTFG